MKTQVKIAKSPKTGLIFNQAVNADGSAKLDKNGKPYGSIRVVADEISLGFAYNGGLKSKSAFINMTVEGWNKSKHMLLEGTIVPGAILTEESTEPFYDAEKEVKRAGVDGPVLTLDGQPIYKRSIYTEDKSLIERGDILVQHNNDVKAAQTAKQSVVLNASAE